MLRHMRDARTSEARLFFAGWLLLCVGLAPVACQRGGADSTAAAQVGTGASAQRTAPGDSIGPTAGHLDAAGAEKLLASRKDVVLIDVRTPAEYSRGHIPGATNLDYTAESFPAELGKLDRSKTYVVHCAAGGRSTQSLAVFARLGFKSVHHLDGGLNGWIAAGKPVEK